MQNQELKQIIDNSFKKVAPIWPLQNFIACNNLSGFDELDFEEAILSAAKIFNKKSISRRLEKINFHSIKYLQSYFDLKQAVIKMPTREKGLFFGVLELLKYDKKIHNNIQNKIDFINEIRAFDKDFLEIINFVLEKLEVNSDQEKQDIIDILIFTLPGFVGYLNYCQDWDHGQDFKDRKASNEEFVALRLVLAYLIIKNKHDVLNFLEQDDFFSAEFLQEKLKIIKSEEKEYQRDFSNKLQQNLLKLNYQSTKYQEIESFDAQMIFCIDVRSHDIRKAIEEQGNYKTYGFAGFFGVPVAVENHHDEDSNAACPVLLKPQHVIKEVFACDKHDHNHQKYVKGKKKLNLLKGFYESLKYSFSTPFALAESIGLWCGFWMSFKTFSPKLSVKISESVKKSIKPEIALKQEIDQKNDEIDNKFFSKVGISFEEQCQYALASLKMMGLVKNFAKIIVLCGHGSQTQNNSYASALECGACGARHGGSNAKILATILNKKEVREFLVKNDIKISDDSLFLAGLHNTTTDEIKIYDEEINKKEYKDAIKKIKSDLEKARKSAVDCDEKEIKSRDWSQTRPEWGLATNASFVVGPRILTQNLELKNKPFLHSYDYRIDEDGSYLEAILTAPMVVTHWINSQYFFSAFDNISYGSGSKITQNISTKTNIMQGNMSDIFAGLPLQSLFLSDKEAYHKPMRLNVFVNAPKEMISKIIERQEILQKLFKNQWLFLFSLDEKNQEIYRLDKDLSWQKI